MCFGVRTLHGRMCQVCNGTPSSDVRTIRRLEGVLGKSRSVEKPVCVVWRCVPQLEPTRVPREKFPVCGTRTIASSRGHSYTQGTSFWGKQTL